LKIRIGSLFETCLTSPVAPEVGLSTCFGFPSSLQLTNNVFDGTLAIDLVGARPVFATAEHNRSSGIALLVRPVTIRVSPARSVYMYGRGLLGIGVGSLQSRLAVIAAQTRRRC
jgi:hypothetical protein